MQQPMQPFVWHFKVYVYGPTWMLHKCDDNLYTMNQFTSRIHILLNVFSFFLHWTQTKFLCRQVFSSSRGHPPAGPRDDLDSRSLRRHPRRLHVPLRCLQRYTGQSSFSTVLDQRNNFFINRNKLMFLKQCNGNAARKPCIVSKCQCPFHIDKVVKLYAVWPFLSSRKKGWKTDIFLESINLFPFVHILSFKTLSIPERVLTMQSLTMQFCQRIEFGNENNKVWEHQINS